MVWIMRLKIYIITFKSALNCLECGLVEYFKGIVLPKKEIVINYSVRPLITVWHSFIFRTQIMIFFDEIRELSDPL